MHRASGLCLRQAHVNYYHTRQCFGHRTKAVDLLHTSRRPSVQEGPAKDARLMRLADAYRNHGHHKALLDPLRLHVTSCPFPLEPEFYDLHGDDVVSTKDVLFAHPTPTTKLSAAVEYLEEMYCGTMALEIAHVSSEQERDWLVKHYEEARHRILSPDKQRKVAECLLRSQAFDHFLAKKFATVKRYGAEGAENMMVFFNEVLSACGQSSVSDVIVGMPHRGRLNLLTGLLDLDTQLIFHKMGGYAEFEAGAPSTGDVVSHLVSSVDIPISSSNTVHVTMLPNPSHLEAVNSVALGKARARQLSLGVWPYSLSPNQKRVLSLQIHGDASFSGQGIVAESLALANLPHFDAGGTLHLVVNNQLGFTTGADHGRSSTHCTDVAKFIGAPILHVNGDYPEDVLRAAHIAMNYWTHFERDIIVNMTCFRRWGHNELDNPSLTQPKMYEMIESRSSLPDQYSTELETAGVVNRQELIGKMDQYSAELNSSLKSSTSYKPPATHLQGSWKAMKNASHHLSQWDTGCPVDLLKYVGAKSVSVPENLHVNSRLRQGHIGERMKQLNQGTGLNWATAESLAIGTLLHQGFNVRLSGQDVGRGTFSHRHAMIVCQETDEAYIPLNSLSHQQTAFLEVANSPLSEEAVLGFEYGFSVESPNHLVLWEAQFGDFFNGAQIIIDTFISSGETKWLYQSGLVLLLPHGYDGAGPDHSSSYVERFLQQCDSTESGPDGDSVNMHVAYPTTPAQYYHLLRRQMVRDFRKPLIVLSPKLLLRLPSAVSSLKDMEPGTTFQPVLADPVQLPAKNIRRIVFCSGKHFYALDSYRREHNITDTAIVRLELLCPFPSGSIHQQLAHYPNATEFVWSQEEPENKGAWSFVQPRFMKQIGCKLSLVSRRAGAASAVGVTKLHEKEAENVRLETFSM